MTRAVVQRCHAAGVSVEAELGEIGGKDGVHAPGVRTDPDEAAAFVADTGVDALAVAVGSSHAMTSRTARSSTWTSWRRSTRRCRCRWCCTAPPGCRTPTSSPRSEAGMTKVNIATHLNAVFTQAVRDHLAADPAVVDTRKYLGAGRAAVEDETIRLMSMLARR